MADKLFVDGSVRAVDVVASKGQLVLDYRFIHPLPFVEKVKCRVQHVRKGKALSDTTKELAETHQNPWVHRLRLPLKHVDGELHVTLSIGSTPKFEDIVPLGPDAPQPKDVTVDQPAPRLVKALNSTPQGTPVFAAASVTDRVSVILKWIVDRLDRGLGETAWLGPDGGRGLSLAELNLSSEARENELWARLIAEKLLGLPYALVGTFYQRSETAFYQRMSERIQAQKDTFYPITIQCQQSCTMALLSLGIPFDLLKPGCNAGNTEGLPIFKQAGAKCHKLDLRDAKKALTATPRASPGTLFEFFSPQKGANQGGAHIGFVLRTHSEGWFALQTFDTGGLGAPNRGPVDLMAVSGGLGGGIFDDPWVKAIKGSPEPPSGMGVLPPKFRPVPTLARWWPLGFARLVLKARSDQQRLYATPLLWMHHGNQSYAPSRLAWSLRALPFGDEIQAIWQVWMPRGKLTDAGFSADRNTPASEVLKVSGRPPAEALKDVSTEILHAFDVIAATDGRVGIVKRLSGTSNTPDTLPWGLRSKDDAAPSMPSLSSVPPYLRGDET
jgi:hypothetical protein